jgi:hypothetical protein
MAIALGGGEQLGRGLGRSDEALGQVEQVAR